MGKIDLLLFDYFQDNQRFADLFNTVCFGGKPIIDAGKLRDASEKYVDSGLKEKQVSERVRDLKKYFDTGILQILAIENQSFVDYSMAFRHMEYDAMEYRRQVKEIKSRNSKELKKKNLTELKSAEKQRDTETIKLISEESHYRQAEWLCKFKRTDKLHPVYTIIVYFGEEPWNGPRSLYDMMDFGEQNEMQKLFSNYPMHLICVNELQEYDTFKTDLKEVFRILKYRKDKTGLRKLINSHPEYRSLEPVTYRVIAGLMGNEKMLKIKETEREGEADMCQALDEIYEDGVKEGIKEGTQIGADRKLMELVCKKLSEEKQ